MITCALEFDIANGHFVAIAIAFVATQAALFELAWLKHTELLKTYLHGLLYLFVCAFNCLNFD